MLRLAPLALFVTTAALAADGGAPETVPSTPVAVDAGAPRAPAANDAGVRRLVKPDAGSPRHVPDGGTRAAARPDAGASPADAGPSPADAGTTHADAGPVPLDAGHTANGPTPDAGVTTAFPRYPGGSHCKMVRTGDNVVLAEHSSTGSVMDCQQEIRAEVRSKHCKESRQRLDVTFIGDWNGTVSEPVQTRINCPKK